jgi:hypothetical protein
VADVVPPHRQQGASGTSLKAPHRSHTLASQQAASPPSSAGGSPNRSSDRTVPALLVGPMVRPRAPAGKADASRDRG